MTGDLTDAVTGLRPYGERAVLLELADGVDPAAAARVLSRTDGVEEVVPAARTVLLRWDARTDPTALLTAARGLRVDPDVDTSTRVERIPVRYDGADLDAVADAAGMSRDEVVARHSGGRYRVRFCGFSPGFAYLDGLDPRLHLPRRDEPRTRVPAGAVAVAGEFAAVYPRASPGGWLLLGSTEAVLWDLDRPDPALLSPGVAVRFEPV